MSTEGLLVMSSNWLKLEPVLAHAEVRLARRVQAHAWIIVYYQRRFTAHIRSHRKWSVEHLKTTAYPGWYDKTRLSLVYDEVALLAAEALTLVLRLRAIKYHGSTVYLDPSYTKVPSLRDYDLHPKLA